jgi:hypothetical protein
MCHSCGNWSCFFLFRNIKIIILLFHTKFVYSLIICSASEIEKKLKGRDVKTRELFGADFELKA